MLAALIGWVAAAQEPQYSLVPPIQQTDISEIGNWTLRGTAVNIKKSIRLTSADKNRVGSICQRVPTFFKEWSIDLEMSARGGEGGHGIWFYYTAEVCPSFPLVYNGFSFWINTTSTDKNGNSDVYFAKNNGTKLNYAELKPVGKARIRDEKKPLKMHISKRSDRLYVDVTQDIVYKRIVDVDVKNVPDYGYFTISAMTTQRTDNIDIISMRVFSMSESDNPQKNENFSAKNRKIIEDSVLVRRELKQKRRARMQYVMNYVKEAAEKQKKLTGSSGHLEEAIKIIDEAYTRGEDMINVIQLQNFIEERIDAAVEKSLDKVQYAQSRLEEARFDIDDLWGDLRRRLLEMTAEEKIACDRIQKEVLETAKSLNLAVADKDKVNTTDAAANGGKKYDWISSVLLAISMVEITAYVIFFLYKRHVTDKFKKAD